MFFPFFFFGHRYGPQRHSIDSIAYRASAVVLVPGGRLCPDDCAGAAPTCSQGLGVYWVYYIYTILIHFTCIYYMTSLYHMIWFTLMNILFHLFLVGRPPYQACQLISNWTHMTSRWFGGKVGIGEGKLCLCKAEGRPRKIERPGQGHTGASRTKCGRSWAWQSDGSISLDWIVHDTTCSLLVFLGTCTIQYS